MHKLLQEHLPLDTTLTARFLLGMILVRVTPEGRTSGRIVETEAYPSGDPSSHSYRGLTPRCRSMFLRHWHAYVYRIYGRSLCLNISSEAAGTGAAVLIRALEPLDGIDIMQRRRATPKLIDLARGPGRLAQAMAIDMELDGIDLDSSSELFVEMGLEPPAIAVSPRIGLSKSIDWPLRFFIPNTPFVSGARKFNQGYSFP
jgi:DNA-3-methyladenine glycosylase